MGGLVESRADPRGVLVLREYPVTVLSGSGRGPQLPQVVFSFDLTSADGLFATRKFEIEPATRFFRPNRRSTTRALSRV